MNKLKAKSDSEESLYTHSKRVEELSLKLLKINTSDVNKYRDYEDVVRLSAFYHDIGKATTSFQKILNGDKPEEDNNGYLHNQVGAAIINNHLNVSNIIYICNIIYWHHGIRTRSKEEKYGDIYNDISDDDIERMCSIIREYTPEYYKEYEENGVSLSDYYHDGGKNSNFKTHELMFMRNIVVYSDRMVSKYPDMSIEELLGIYNSSMISGVSVPFISPEYYDKERVEIQEGIINDCSDNGTYVIKAPAGFGKTLLGLKWNRKNNKRCFWVCPRNSVAESVYESILSELEAHSDSQTKVELYITNEVKKSNWDVKNDELTSDIVVINIDSFLKQNFDNSHLDRGLNINTMDVIFDEYHELFGEDALFSLFVYIMKIRHNITKSNTLLLSATPGLTKEIANRLWGNFEGRSTIILPNDDNHYPAAHNKPYIINNEEINIEENHLFIHNSIANSQRKYLNITSDDKLLIHSKFEDETKKGKIDELYKMYGKESNVELKKAVSSAPIIQASFDISFNYLTESVSSPENTLQRIGRCNRWGEYNEALVCTFLSEDRGEEMAIQYDDGLRRRWYNKISKVFGRGITLDEIYSLYNKFINDNKNDILKYYNDKLDKSKENLKAIYPFKYTKGTKKKDRFGIGSNKLRNTSNGIFIIVKKDNGEWSDVFTDSNYRDGKYGEHTKIILNKIEEELLDDDRFSFEKKNNHQRKKITHNMLINNAQYSDQPLPVFKEDGFDIKYSDVLGIYNGKIFE